MRILILVLFLASWVNPLAFSQSATEVSGLIIPRDNQGMYIRNEEGQSEITWTSKTKVALVMNNRLLSGLKGDRLTYKIHSSKEVVIFSIPKGPITGIKTSRGGKQLERTLKEAREEKWISEGGLQLYFNQKPAKEQLGTKDDSRFIGTWNPSTRPRTLSINGAKYEISMKKGGQTKALLYNLLTVKHRVPPRDADLLKDELAWLGRHDSSCNGGFRAESSRIRKLLSDRLIQIDAGAWRFKERNVGYERA